MDKRLGEFAKTPGSLHGIKIPGFTQIIAGPFGEMTLADMGADVINTEPLEGEPCRLALRFIPGESPKRMSFNQGKRNLPLDLSEPIKEEGICWLRFALGCASGFPPALPRWRHSFAGMTGEEQEARRRRNCAWRRRHPSPLPSRERGYVVCDSRLISGGYLGWVTLDSRFRGNDGEQSGNVRRKARQWR